MGRVVAPPVPDMVVSVVTGAAARAGAACVAPVAAPPPPTPVVPIGVPCELCWPAPVAALGLAALASPLLTPVGLTMLSTTVLVVVAIWESAIRRQGA